MNKYRKFFTGVLAAAMLFTSIPAASAASSSELKKELEKLRKEQSSMTAQIEKLKEKENVNWSSTEEMIAQKDNIDEQMFLLYAQLQNLEDQIMEYGQLIAQNQQELDQARERLEELNEKNKERIRAMEEGGSLSYWSVIFKANSFTDLIDRLSMIQEIAAADRRMLDSLDEAAKEVARVQEELKGQKTQLEASRADQLEAQKELEAKRAEADEILTALNAERLDLEEDHAAADEAKNALMQEIAQSEKELNEQLKREEEERRKQEEANKPKPKPGKPDNPAPPPSSDKGWLQPCSYIMISSPYGWRSRGWHNGVDFAANRGTPIYASRSGTVTRARQMTTSYGNHVVINHGDGFSSLYAHMEYFVVSNGQYVSQGQLIGYVGSTGNSTGPHLHFTIMYNGQDVNPMEYL